MPDDWFGILKSKIAMPQSQQTIHSDFVPSEFSLLNYILCLFYQPATLSYSLAKRLSQALLPSSG